MTDKHTTAPESLPAQVQRTNEHYVAEIKRLREALAEYVVLGPGKCTIGKATAAKGLTALSPLEPAP